MEQIFLPHVTPNISLNSSRLVRTLSEMLVEEGPITHKDFAERMADILDFSSSINLLEAFDEISVLEFNESKDLSRTIKEEFLTARASMVQFIIKSFVQKDGHIRVRSPLLNESEPKENFKKFELFQRFYVAHQREMDFRVHNLRLDARTAIAGLSRPLAQLAALDLALTNILANYARQCFGTIQSLLSKRFKYLYKEHQRKLAQIQLEDAPEKWFIVGGWLDQFSNEMQGLLLAELEVRLQPVLGLIEAINSGEHNHR